jgi:soluble lytic murein transglycosylase
VSPSATTTPASRRRENARRAAARRRTAARRRSAVLIVGGVLVVAVAVVLSMPFVRKAVNELGLPLANADVIRQQAAEKHLDPALIAAVIYAETKFEPRVSVAGAVGLMQVMPETAEFLARRSGATTFTVADLSTPQVNIAYGSYYLRYLIDEFRGNVMFALAAYNGGDANVDQWIAEARSQGHKLTVQEIPFPETRAYVEKVLAAQQDYRHKYASQLYG